MKLSRIAIVGLAVTLAALSNCSHRNGGPLLSAPPSATADRDVYVADADRIRALDQNGKEQWSFSLSDELVRLDKAASHDIEIDYLVARSGGRLFGLAMQQSGRRAGQRILFALESNHLQWYRDVPVPAQDITPIAIDADAIYEAGEDGSLYAFAQSDGSSRWQHRVSAGALGAPTIGSDGTIYVTGARHNLHAVAPDGTLRWTIETHR